MSYEWIRPGVKAVIVGTVDYSGLLNGRIVTIEKIIAPKGEPGVMLEESEALAEEFCPDKLWLIAAPHCLRPYHEPGSWDNEAFEYWNPIKQPEEVTA